MANRVGSENQSPSRAPIRLSVPYFFWVRCSLGGDTRDTRRLFGDLPRRPVAAAVLSIPPIHKSRVQRWPGDLKLTSGNARVATKWPRAPPRPVYQEIVAFYLHHSADRNEKSDLLTSTVFSSRSSPARMGQFCAGPAESGLSIETALPSRVGF